MPIFIDECINCNQVPNWDYNEIGWGPAELILRCEQCGAEVANFTLEDASWDWVELNNPGLYGETPEDEE
jgi:hypothetical protein